MDSEMVNQRTKNWNKRFLNKDTPWEEEGPSQYLAEILSDYTKPGEALLEIGCGLGVNARWFAKLGYQVTAIDVSEIAINNAKEYSKSISNISFMCTEFFDSNLEQKFDVVFDKGCLHTFTDVNSYLKFAEKVAEYLKPEGVWINISGNADQPEDLDKRVCEKYPRMTLKDIVLSIEPNFEILEIKRGIFGERNNFLSWNGVYRKR